MKKNEDILSVKELETLCNLFMKCELTRLEEMELEVILLQTDAESHLIHETKKIMATETFLSLQKTNKKKYAWKYKLSWIAATVVLIAIILSTFIYKSNPFDETSTYCQVYSEGAVVNNNEAKHIAQKHIERMKEFEIRIEQIQSIEQNKVKSFVNKFPQ